MNLLANIMSMIVVALFIVISFLTIITYAQTCETRCLQKDLVTGECTVWVTDCWDN